MNRVAGFDRYPAAFVGIGENPNAGDVPWNYDVGGAAKLKRMCCGKELPWFNLYQVEPSPWDRQEARGVATKFCLDLQEKNRTWTLLLLGVKVCSAFGIEKPEWLEWYRSPLWGPMIAVPHPSGLNRWWNDAEHRRAATELLSAIAIGLLPSAEHEPVTT